MAELSGRGRATASLGIRCAECGATLARWDEPHTVEDCQAYRDLSPADKGAYEEAVEIVRSERCSS